jgi:hypothetical protein
LKAKWPTAQRRQDYYQDAVNCDLNNSGQTALESKRSDHNQLRIPWTTSTGSELDAQTPWGRPRRELLTDRHLNDINVHSGFPNNCVEFWPKAIKSTRYGTFQDVSRRPSSLHWDHSPWLKSI